MKSFWHCWSIHLECKSTHNRISNCLPLMQWERMKILDCRSKMSKKKTIKTKYLQCFCSNQSCIHWFIKSHEFRSFSLTKKKRKNNSMFCVHRFRNWAFQFWTIERGDSCLRFLLLFFWVNFYATVIQLKNRRVCIFLSLNLQNNRNYETNWFYVSRDLLSCFKCSLNCG